MSALKKSLLAVAATLVLALPAQSAVVDPVEPVTSGSSGPTIGLGLSLSFGGGQPQTAIGLRVFSDNTANSVVGSLGVDYLLKSKTWRGTVGAAYLGNSAYMGLDMGLGFGGGGIDFGFSGGVVDTQGAPGDGADSSPEVGDPNPNGDGSTWDGTTYTF